MERVVQRINNDWKFMYGDNPEGREADFNDSSWYDVSLPHSFGIPYFMENDFYVGYGCYRRKLFISGEWLSKKVTLCCQGIFQEAEVFLNGKKVKEHIGGYTPFEVDLSKEAHEGENLLFVRVNNLWNGKAAPRAGEHVFNGGIYREITLIVKERIYIDWYGTFVTTKNLTDRKAIVSIKTDIGDERDISGRKETEQIVLCSAIFYKGTEVGRTKSVFKAAEKMQTISQEMILPNPKLWHPDSPELYILKSYVSLSDGKSEGLMDTGETEFGIRFIEFTKDQGFFLNGKHFLIHGANVHQDHAGWSDAVTHSGIERDVRLIKECGMNFIRGSHYPHHTYFAEQCDKQGILFWSENCFWGTGGPNEDGYWTASAYPTNPDDEEAFEHHCMQTLTEMIRTNRNHPSIIAWSMCNEPFFSSAEVMEKAKALVVKLVDLCHRLDSTRPAAVGGVQRGGFDSLGDLAGYNGDGATMFQNPGFPNLVSEYGSTVSDRPGKYAPGYTDGVEEDFSWRSGKSLWCAFHHGSIFGEMGHMGMIDYYRLPLRSYYWYRKHFLGIAPPNEVPEGKADSILLSADKLVVATDGTEDTQLFVSLLDGNGDRVAENRTVVLTVESGGALFPTGMSFEFSFEKKNFYEGLGAIEIRSSIAGECVIRASSKGLPDARIVITFTEDKNRNEESPDRKSSGQKSVSPVIQRNLPKPPPYRTSAPVPKKRYAISKSRPVFCSSFSAEHPAKNVTEDSFELYWYPENKAPGSYVTLDLEGPRFCKEYLIIFREPVKGQYKLETSEDGENYTQIYRSGSLDKDTFLSGNLGKKLRFFRLTFFGEPVGVSKIEIMA